MASNFRIIFQQKDRDVHLKLSGDFDGSSAYKLVNILERFQVDKRKIFIHTSDISTPYSFGIEIFKTKYSWYKNLIFTY